MMYATEQHRGTGRTHTKPKVNTVHLIELSLCIEGIIELKRGLYRFWIFLLLLQEVDHLKRLSDVWNLLFEATTSLSSVELHELIFGHGLLELFQCWLDILVWSAEVFLHIGLW